jgi:hypothetical protein
MILTKAKFKGIKEFITGWRLVFFIPTTELEEDSKLTIQQALSNDGWLTFSPDKLKAEVEKIMKDRTIGASTEGKSKSEILRGSLYKYWTTVYKGDKSFDDFYAAKMDGFITYINQTIEQIEIDQIDKFYNQH